MKNLDGAVNFREITCPSCQGGYLKSIGKIPDSDFFAGKQLSIKIPGGNLYKCHQCGLFFRYPRLVKNDADKLYQFADSTHWKYRNKIRNDWLLANTFLENIKGGGAILDVACWTGGFLSKQPDQWTKFGIEINQEAAVEARKNGVDIIGNDIYKANHQFAGYFDVITAFDIIEHVDDPVEFVKTLLAYARPGGYIFIGTGNTNAWAWKLAKNRYLYCWQPEHISFFNKQWFQYMQKELGYIMEEARIIFHNPPPFFVYRALQFIANIFYLFAPLWFRNVRRLWWKVVKRPQRMVDDFPPSWITKDHLFVVLRKAE